MFTSDYDVNELVDPINQTSVVLYLYFNHLIDTQTEIDCSPNMYLKQKGDTKTLLFLVVLQFVDNITTI